MPAGCHMYCTVTAIFPPHKAGPLSPCGSPEKRGTSARMDLSCCQPTHFGCQVPGQIAAPHAGLRYGHHSQSCHHPHAIVTTDTTVSCRGQQHPATKHLEDKAVLLMKVSRTVFPHTELSFHGSQFVIQWVFLHTTDKIRT